MRARAFAAALLFALAGVPAMAQTVAYTEAATGPGGQGVLYRVNLTTNVAQPGGSAGSDAAGYPYTLTGLTMSPSKQLYAISATPTPHLVRVAYAGTASVAGDLGGISQTEAGTSSLAFTCDGRLWMSSPSTSTFRQLDPASGAILSSASLSSPITGMTSGGNTLYGTGGASSGSSVNRLYQIDTDSGTLGTLSVVGSYNVAGWVGMVSPAFDASGQMWALIDTAPVNGSTAVSWNTVARIDATSGAMTQQGTIQNLSTLQYLPMRGLAIVPPTCSGASPTDADDPPAAAIYDSPALRPWSAVTLGLCLAFGALAALYRRRNAN